MILVTGATGNLGKATIDFLLKKVPANQIAAMVRNPDKAVELKEKGIEVRIGDYTDVASMKQAFTDIDKLLLVSSSDVSNRAEHHINAVNAAKEASVKHVFYTGTDIKDLNNSAISMVTSSHARTAELLKESGMKYTILRNNLYTDVIPDFLGPQVLETGIFFPAGDGKASFVVRKDMAKATANLLASEGNVNNEYAFSASRSYSFQDVADALSELSGKKINYYSPSAEEFTEAMTKAGVPEMMIGFTIAFAEAIKQNEFDLPNNAFENILGRKPTSLKDYLQSIYFSNNY